MHINDTEVVPDCKALLGMSESHLRGHTSFRHLLLISLQRSCDLQVSRHVLGLIRNHQGGDLGWEG